MRASTRRKLTAKEHAHVARLLWRVPQAHLAKRLGIKVAQLSQAMRELPLQETHIQKLTEIKLADLPAMRIRKLSGGTHPGRGRRGYADAGGLAAPSRVEDLPDW